MILPLPLNKIAEKILNNKVKPISSFYYNQYVQNTKRGLMSDIETMPVTTHNQDLLRSLETLQALYKSNFDLMMKRLESQALLVEKMIAEMQDQIIKPMIDLKDLLEEQVAEKDVETQRLMKAVAALTLVTEQLTAKYNQERQ